MAVSELQKKVNSQNGEFDILCIGELLTDYISKEDKPLKEVELFEKFLGGSPANIVLHFKNLRKHPLLITKIGKDNDGQFLLDILSKFEVMASHVKLSSDKKTTRSVIGRQKHAATETPEFEIIRGADANLKKEDIDMSLVKKAKMIHTNSFSLAEEPTRSSIIHVIEEAHNNNKIISFDPNYRLSVWPNTQEALEVFRKIYPMVDLTKPSMDDAQALFGKLKPRQYIKKYHELGAKIVVLTMGSAGSLISDGSKIIKVPVEQCEAIDATGAGDLYWSVFLKGLLEGNSLQKCGKMASYGATKAVKTYGAILSEEDYLEMNAYMDMIE